MQPVVTTDIHERQKLFARVLLASQDALEAREYVGRATRLGPPELLNRDDRVALAAWISAFVVAYGRCFVSSRSNKKPLPSFADRFVTTLEVSQAQLHNRLRDLRDREFAHSDASVADIDVGVMNNQALVPISRILRIHSLEQDDLLKAEALVNSLITFLSQELLVLQGQLTTSGGFSFRAS